MKILSAVILVFATAAQAQTPLSASYQLPSLQGFPSFLSLWKEAISNSNPAITTKIRLHQTPIESIMDLQIPEQILLEYGTLLSLGLEAGKGSKELGTWMRILRDLFPVLENATAVPPFRPSLKLLETPLKEPLKEDGLGVKKFLKIEIDSKAPPWEAQLCRRIIPWIHTAQLLAGRSSEAEFGRKESLTLTCKLLHFADLKKRTHFLQLTELPLPYQDTKDNSYLFRHPEDLYSSDSLQRLQKIK